MRKQPRPGFGKPGSITREALFALPPAMQAEGVRLLFEMGMSWQAVMSHTGLGPGAVLRLRDSEEVFKRGGEADYAV